MGNIVLTRIDSRLIHGQVMTKWVNQVQANKIVVVSDELANDEFMRSIYLMSAPAGIEVECVTEAQAVEQYKADVFGSGNVLLLLPSLKALKNVYDQGLTVKSVQVGGLGGGPERKVVFQNITLDDPDAAILDALAADGVQIVFQTIPEDAPQTVDAILKKYRG
ncbi:PTS system mannose/fructose/N-acetylgalactosamine-transporter subunit IIB [Thermophilibacter sp.]